MNKMYMNTAAFDV